MLQTIKSTAVVGTLLIVGYGVHIVLNKAPSGDDPIWNNAQEFSLPSIEFGSAGNGSALADSQVPTMPSAAGESLSSTGLVDSGVSPTSVPDAFPTPGGGGYPSTSAPSFPPVENFPNPTTTPGDAIAAPYAGTPGQPLNGPSVPSYPVPQPDHVPGEMAQPPSELMNSTTMDANTGQIAAAAHTTAFDDMWTSAQQKLQTGDFTNALLSLSILYSDDSLFDVQRDRLITLLDQLAGTVIYSPEHMISPPYVVAPGDTLESIATQMQVPAVFLSRVNKIPLHSPVQPGQQLKVVSGPFRAELALSRREMTLFLGRYYAGRFNVGIGRDLPAHASSMEVFEKSGQRPYFDARTGQTIAAGHPECPYGQFWIGLRSGGQVDPTLGIHDTGQAVQASDTRGCITVSSRDADDLQAILSLGSRIDLIR